MDKIIMFMVKYMRHLLKLATQFVTQLVHNVVVILCMLVTYSPLSTLGNRYLYCYQEWIREST